jgi:hypothetical protein
MPMIVGILFTLAFIAFCAAFNPTSEVRYIPIASYAERGDGKSSFSRNKPTISRSACLKEAQQKYLSTDNTILWGRIEKQNDGVEAPKWRGCEVIDHMGRATGEVVK